MAWTGQAKAHSRQRMLGACPLSIGPRLVFQNADSLTLAAIQTGILPIKIMMAGPAKEGRDETGGAKVGAKGPAAIKEPQGEGGRHHRHHDQEQGPQNDAPPIKA